MKVWITNIQAQEMIHVIKYFDLTADTMIIPSSDLSKTLLQLSDEDLMTLHDTCEWDNLPEWLLNIVKKGGLIR